MAVSRSKKKAQPALTKPAPIAAPKKVEKPAAPPAKDELALLQERVARLESKLAKLIAAVPLPGSIRRTL